MKYTEVKFYCTGCEEWQKDLFIDELSQIGFDTFEEHDDGFTGYIPSSQFDEGQLEWQMAQLDNGFSVRYDVREIQPENWNAVWESSFNPIQIGEDCYVRATFHEAQPQIPYEIIIDPKMSFGTGHHQTTSMMLRYILENDPQGMRVLDMGCGTGILAILAVKRGADSAVAIDFDPVCVDSVVENSRINGVDSQVVGRLGSAEAIGNDQFDVVYANINRNILLEQLGDYHQAMNFGAKLYLSGFFIENDLDIIKINAEKLGFQYLDHKVDGPWAAACFQK